MRIDPAQLFTAFTPSEADHRAAREFLRSHIGEDEDPTPGMLELTLALLHLPAAWHFEHDGWWVGGLGGFTGMPHWDMGLHHHDRIFLCNDRVGWLVQHKAFAKVVNGMRSEGLTDPGVFLDRLTQGVTPRQFMESFGKAKTLLGPYERPRVTPAEQAYNTPCQGLLDPGETFTERFTSLARMAAGISSIHGYGYGVGGTGELRQTGRKSACKALMERVQDQAQKTHESLLKAVSAHAVSAAEQAGFGDLRLVSWLTLGHSERRIQALLAQPGTLGGLVMRYWVPMPSGPIRAHHMVIEQQSPESIRERQTVTRHGLRLAAQGLAAIAHNIDEGRSWYADAAQWLTQLHAAQGMRVDEHYPQELLRGFQRIGRLPQAQRPTKKTLDHVRHLHPHLDDAGGLAMEGEAVSQAAVVVWLTGILQTADLPLNDGQWAALRETLSSLMGQDRLASSETHSATERLPCLSLASFRNYRHRLKDVAQPLSETSQDWLLPFALIHELGDTCSETTQWVSASTGKNARTVSLVLDAHWTVQQWQRAQRTLHGYHHQFTQRQAAAKAESMALLEKEVALWPLGEGMPQTAECQGVAFHALANPSALLREGEYMGHCVAGYSPACFAGRSRIYSVTHQQTGERATLELVWDDRMSGRAYPGGRMPRVPAFAYPTPQLCIRQLRGFHNGPVTQSLQKAAEAFLAACRAQESLAPWPAMETPEEWRGEQHQPDDLFYQQVRQWVAQQHPRLYAQLIAQPT